jgi:hypothetical protein
MLVGRNDKSLMCFHFSKGHDADDFCHNMQKRRLFLATAIRAYSVRIYSIDERIYMSDLTSVEKLKLEKIFGMEGGYVFNFSNRTFQEFILENINVDIYDAKYSYYSGSKANRLRALWAKESNMVVGELIDRLLEYWKEKHFIENQLNTLNEEALYDSCKIIAGRLRGVIQADTKQDQSNEKDEFIQKQKNLLSTFDDFATLSSASDTRRRGYLLEELLENTFRLYGIKTEKGFKRNNGGEQIDGAFSLEGWHYIVECKWTEKLADIRQLDSLYGKLNRSGKQTMGLFLSINGWSDNVVTLLKQNQDKSILLMDGYDLRCTLNYQIDLNLRKLILKKVSVLNFYSEPFYSAFKYINEL